MAAATGTGMQRLKAVSSGPGSFGLVLRQQLTELSIGESGSAEKLQELVLQDATLAKATLVDAPGCEVSALPAVDEEGNVHADVLVRAGTIAAIAPPGKLPEASSGCSRKVCNLQKRMVSPCFCEPHAHLFKSQACPRCPNPTGSMNDARCSEFADRPWSFEDLTRRMEFTMKCALAHGMRVIRTHLDGTEDDRPEQREACWKAFDHMRKDFEGAIDLQGVANLYLPLWSSPEHRERQLPEILARRPHVILGAYCGIIREHQMEEATVHFQSLFGLASKHDLPVDLHIDESNDESARGLLAAMNVLKEVRKQGYKAPVTCGHSCSLTRVPADALAATIAGMKEATGVLVVANPPTNLWLQDRRGQDDTAGTVIPEDVPRTPLWRGMTACQELLAAGGIAIGIGGDNVRDWWHNYGDSDPLQNFRLGVYAAHLDKPHGALSNWAGATSCVNAEGLGDEFNHAVLGQHKALALGPGAPSDLVIFNARSFSELLSRPQSDRVVLRALRTGEDGGGGLQVLQGGLPEYSDLDDLVAKKTIVDRSGILHKGDMKSLAKSAKMGF